MGEKVEQESGQMNEGWADVMQKILNSKKPKRKKTIVLAKAKKLSSIKSDPLKVEEQDENEKKEEIKIKEFKIRKVEWLSKGHQKHNPLDRNRERTLQKTAVRGVVQLFNAVNQHQKSIVKPNTSTFKMEKQLKSIDRNTFLGILSKGTNLHAAKAEEDVNEEKKVKPEDEEISSSDDESNTWSVLKNDFLTSTKRQNWDKSNLDDIENAEI